MKIGITAGTFDLLHAGHILFLEKCREKCDRLVVMLQTDPTIDRPEKNRPAQTTLERFIQLQAVMGVDQIIPYDTERDFENILLTLPWNIRFLDETYKGKEYTGHHIYPDKHYFTKRSHNYSTTELRERVANSHSIKKR